MKIEKTHRTQERASLRGFMSCRVGKCLFLPTRTAF